VRFGFRGGLLIKPRAFYMNEVARNERDAADKSRIAPPRTGTGFLPAFHAIYFSRGVSMGAANIVN